MKMQSQHFVYNAPSKKESYPISSIIQAKKKTYKLLPPFFNPFPNKLWFSVFMVFSCLLYKSFENTVGKNALKKNYKDLKKNQT